MTNIPIRDEAHWHELRGKHVGCSELAALFDEHPNTTKFEIWHIKNGTLPAPNLDDNSRVFWGQTLEPAIALGVARMKGWNVRKVRRYIEHDEVPGFGGTLDYEITNHDRGPGVLEIKNVDGLVARNWEDGEPGLHQMLQVQGQLALTGRSWGALGVLVGGNDLRIFEYERRPKVIAKIEAAVAEFWRSIREGREPKPDFTQDGAAIAALHSAADGDKVIDLTGDNRLPELCAEYRAAAEIAKQAEARKDAAKAEILTKIGDAGKVLVGPYTISAKQVAGTHVAYDRKSYRDFRMTERKQKDLAA